MHKVYDKGRKLNIDFYILTFDDEKEYILRKRTASRVW